MGGAAVGGIAVGGTVVGADRVAVADAQAESNTLTIINIETSNLRVFIFLSFVFGLNVCTIETESQALRSVEMYTKIDTMNCV